MQALQNSSAGMMLKLTDAAMDQSLRAMLDSTRHLRCTDPRDKVYAILNVVRSGRLNIRANYTSTLPGLMNHVLRNMHIIKWPLTLHDVTKQCEDLENLFGVIPGSIYSIDSTEHEALPLCFHPLSHLESKATDRLDWLFRDNFDLKLDDVHKWCKHRYHRFIAHKINSDLARFRKRLEKWCEHCDDQASGQTDLDFRERDLMRSLKAREGILGYAPQDDPVIYTRNEIIESDVTLEVLTRFCEKCLGILDLLERI